MSAMPASKNRSFLTEYLNSVNARMAGRGKPQNLDNFVAVSRGILQTGPRNLAKFSTKNVGPINDH